MHGNLKDFKPFPKTINLKTMKQLSSASFSRTIFNTLFFFLLSAGIAGCSKSDSTPAPPPESSGPDASTYAADVVNKWMTLELRLMRDATGIPNVAFARYYVYSG